MLIAALICFTILCLGVSFLMHKDDMTEGTILVVLVYLLGMLALVFA